MKNIYFFLFSLFYFTLPAKEFPKINGMPHIIEGSKLPSVKPIFGDFLFISTTEVSNLEYKDFLSWLLKNKPADYISNLPDSTKWRNPRGYLEPFVEHYFRHPAYADYPVVNISQKQAMNFCQYLHDLLKEKFKTTYPEIQEFLVRLPNEKEWMMAARGGLPESAIYPWGTEDIRAGDENKKHKGEFLLNCTRARGQYAMKLNDNGFITVPVKSNYPNSFGLYNMSGNVAEWIAEKGKSKGGSWNLPPYNARIDVPGAYDGDTSAKSDIGFRYIIEIISIKNQPASTIKVDANYFIRSLIQLPTDSTFREFLFAGEHELTNNEYAIFLQENKTPEFQIQASQWNIYFPYKYYEMYGWQSAYGNYPVVNISQEAAKAYCEWATVKYNQSENRKYKKVVFRLPTEKEWEYAASSGKNNMMFPWNGPYVRNAKGCYLANFCDYEDQYFYKKDTTWFYNYPNHDRSISRGIDGLIIPGEVHSYFPNNFGLYNCAGNVAEMVQEPTILKGGSWNSGGYDLEIFGRDHYTGSSPDIGFRMFMEVLEK